MVAHEQVQAWFDDDYKVAQENLTGQGLPSNCTSSGIFLRVWGEALNFMILLLHQISEILRGNSKLRTTLRMGSWGAIRADY